MLQKLKEISSPVKLLLACALYSAATITMAYYPDEWGQITRFYGSKLHWPITEPMVWEHPLMMRPWFQPFYSWLIAWPIQLFMGIRPMLIERVIYLCNFGLFSLAVWWFYLWAKPAGNIHRYKYFSTIALASVASIWFVPSMLIRHSSEAFSIVFMVPAFYFWSKIDKKFVKYGLWAGFFAGLSVCARVHSGIFLAPYFLCFGIIAIIRKQQGIVKASLAFLSAFIIAMAIFSVLVDYWGYGEITLSGYNYFYHSMKLNWSQTFGESPWYWYLPRLFLYLPNPVLWISFFYAAYKLRDDTQAISLAVASIVFIAVHSAIGHKEIRFMLTLLPAFSYLILKLFSLFDESKGLTGFEKVLSHRYYHRPMIVVQIIAMVAFTLFGKYNTSRYDGNKLLEKLPAKSKVIMNRNEYYAYSEFFSTDGKPVLAHAIKKERWEDVLMPDIETIFSTTPDMVKACKKYPQAYVYLSRINQLKDKTFSLVDFDFSKIISQSPWYFTAMHWLTKKWPTKYYYRLRRFKIVSCDQFTKEITQLQLDRYLSRSSW